MDTTRRIIRAVARDGALRLGSCLLVLVALELVARADPLLKVKEVQWTNRVTDAQYGETYDGSAPLQPIYLWMRVAGGTDALSALRTAGKLPLRHLWFKASGAALRYDTQTDAINLDIGRPEVLEPLTRELEHRGLFDWRTWSMKEHVSPGEWLVKLQYADHTPVLCGAEHRPCEFWISISE